MSKMSQLHAELSEHASELGFETLEQAIEAGFEPNYTTGRLDKVGYKPVDGRELAHKDWLERKEIILKNLEGIYDSYIEGDYKTNIEKATIKKAIDFIKEGEI